MSIRNRLALAAMLLGVGSAYGDGIGGSVTPQARGGISQFDGGVSVLLTKPVAPVACTNQLILIYSNSCALIGQGFGQ